MQATVMSVERLACWPLVGPRQFRHAIGSKYVGAKFRGLQSEGGKLDPDQFTRLGLKSCARTMERAFFEKCKRPTADSFENYEVAEIAFTAAGALRLVLWSAGHPTGEAPDLWRAALGALPDPRGPKISEVP